MHAEQFVGWVKPTETDLNLVGFTHPTTALRPQPVVKTLASNLDEIRVCMQDRLSRTVVTTLHSTIRDANNRRNAETTEESQRTAETAEESQGCVHLRSTRSLVSELPP